MLLSHPDVAEAAAFPVRSELAEDEVMAAIVLRDGCSLSPAALAEVLPGSHARVRDPTLYRDDGGTPDDRNGKVQKFRLRERGVTAATWDRGAR